MSGRKLAFITCSFIFCIGLLHAENEAVVAKASAKNEKPVPRHDPVGQPFRRAPMASATRSVVIPLSTNVNLAFDAELLRTHVVWQGSSLNLFGPPYHGSSDRFICDFDGQPLWTTPQIFPWSSETNVSSGSKKIPANFKGISTKNAETVLMYELNFDEHHPVRVHETPRLIKLKDTFAVMRRFEIAPCETDLFFLAQAERGNFLPHNEFSSAIQRGEDNLMVVIRGGDKASLISTDEEAAYDEVLFLEKNGKGPGLDRKTNHVARTEARIYVKIPAHKNAVAFEVATAVYTDQSDWPALERQLSNGGVGAVDMAFVTDSKPGAATSSKVELTGDKTFFPRLDGDKFYKVEHFPLPKEADLRVTGMDFLPNGDLMVCTWAGDIYIVHNAQGDVRNATYRRFARGLIEPMGLKIVGGQIYVGQKGELTRIMDTDGNGEADLYEAINSNWGFTGRYNDFSFGPETDKNGNFFIFLGGNPGYAGRAVYWDVAYMGWALKISPDGQKLEPFCSGLRVPNGFARFEDEIFVTENQGNWIGACKLNHLQPGKFYGFPSSWPSPREDYERTTNFAPPAIWFPYTLAKSASGIAVISDDKFGPFKGQMLVADYQLSVVTRVMLEKIKGEYQGAVWPFAKGFLSGINRITYGPDGNVYVGGGKGGHWSGAVGPQLYSLDRLSPTGKVPFEIKEVHARRDGFELTFTQPADVTTVTNAENYDVSQYTYIYHAKYGSPEIDFGGKENSATQIKVAKVALSEDKMKARLTLEGLRAGYVTAVHTLDIANEDGEELRHNTFWYTLNNIPEE